MRAIDTIMDSESSDADEGVENVGKNDRALTELQNSIQPERFVYNKYSIVYYSLNCNHFNAFCSESLSTPSSEFQRIPKRLKLCVSPAMRVSTSHGIYTCIIIMQSYAHTQVVESRNDE